MIRSLRARLFVGMTVVIVAAGCAGGAFAYFWAFDEAIEMQDSILIQIASIVKGGTLDGGQPLGGVDEDAQVVVVELGTAPHGSPEDRQLFSLQDGLRMSHRGGQPVRVLLRTRPDGSRFAVAQRTAIRDEIAQELALRTLVPIAALVPCLMLITALVIAGSLRPVVRLARDLDARRAGDMSELPAAGTPSELHPFIASINGLLERVKLMLEQQRRFIADAAHELRTPITALSLQAENLEAVPLSTEARDRLASLRSGMLRTQHLLEQLLALARQDADEPDSTEPVALDRIAKEVVADFLPEAVRRGVDLGFARADPVLTVGRPVMLSTVLRNLIGNAVRFAPDGGQVDIDLHREGHHAVLTVEDNGPGIAQGDLDRIFEPFFRGSRPAADGTGLGLSIVKRIIERLDGSVEIENRSGGAGLRATIRLPAAALSPDGKPTT
jgi:two-component system, OmpR family, sensor kinase